MPIFEYVCQECKKRFETLVYGSQKAKCPHCGSNKLDPQLSVFAVSGKSSSASGTSAGPCGTCGDPRGAGACAVSDFD
jgi:putative FmdB family regulatory protein